MRALYQRKKERDLFDLAVALKKTSVDAERIVEAFSAYMDQQGHRVTRAQFEQILRQKFARRSSSQILLRCWPKGSRGI